MAHDAHQPGRGRQHRLDDLALQKMGGKSPGPYTFPPPANWSKIVAFASQTREDHTVKERNAVRPQQSETDTIFAEMLENEKNEHITVHPEYLNLPGITAH